MSDTFTKDGAEHLANRIRAYWAVEGTELWIVRSDMLNARPQPDPLLGAV